ncbi:MAG: T9SS type A sorting domain-containing protein [Flavobacteriales bacterium]|nr:T9SS type A sorting domain-containing protein [Flavobacteriales bacterium]
MRNRYAILFLLGLLPAFAQAQFCDPSFSFGCFNWQNLSVTAGSINWSLGSDDCATSDYTSLSTTVAAGNNLHLTVVNGVWCGCAVWVDLDNSSSFEDSENLYYAYQGGDPSHTYDFNVSIPAGTPTGAYRMRVIAPWGSDGFLDTNTNGYGPCGSYQYGNFTDFTVNIVGSTGIANTANTTLMITHDPILETVVITGASAMGRLAILDSQGRTVEEHGVQSDRIMIDTQSWAKGVYVACVSNAHGIGSQRFVVE